MDAHTVWRTWRRILREPRLQAAMFGDAQGAAALPIDLNEEEMAVVRAYGAAERGTRWFIANYRYRLTSSFFNALETAAPLTHRALRAAALDLHAFAIDFLDSVGWRDFGPFVFTYCGQILDYLRERSEIVARPVLRDLIRIERAGVNVVVGATKATPAERSSLPALWRAAPWCELVHCDYDLSGWLRGKDALVQPPPAPKPRWFVVYLRSLEEHRRIAAIPQRAADILLTLRRPQSEEALRSILAETGDAARDRKVLGELQSLGLVLPPLQPS